MSGTHIGIIDGLLKRVADTEAERDAAYAERDLHIRAGELMAQEIEKLRKALEFYGNSSLYDWDGNPDHLKPIERDAGRTAHVALGYLPATEEPK